jgi:proteasome alpha subunit
MAAPFYVSPEQWYTEKAEFARKGISRGKPITALDYDGGIVIMAENRSTGLKKIAEIYDRIGFAAVGKFDEYENLRKAGVRYADMRGFSFSREDVAAGNLANEYSTVLGTIFTREMKPFEVEILVCEVGNGSGTGNTYYRILFDGFISDQKRFAAIGGDAEQMNEALGKGWREGLSLAEAVRLGRDVLGRANAGAAVLDQETLEIAVLNRAREGRKFQRLDNDEVRELIG